MRLARRAALVAAALAVTVPAQAAQAATVTLDRACYSPGDAITQTGSGFTPNGGVSESLQLFDPESGQELSFRTAPPVTADGQGAFTRLIRAPALAREVDRTEIAASTFVDQTDPQNTFAAVMWTLSAWELNIAAWANGKAKPRKQMVIDTYGWTSAGSTLYGHYYRGGKRIKDVKFGALTGDCGDLRRRVKQFPFRTVRPGSWKVYFSATRKFDKADGGYIWFKVRVPG
jgi:hypothetical protein